jgi:hypothetical protein
MLQKFLAGLLLSGLLLAPAAGLAQPTDSFSELENENLAQDPLNEIKTGNETDLAGAVERLLRSVIMLMGIVAVFVIVLVGVGLIIGVGSEESRARAIKVLLYTAAGIIVIGISSALVRFVVKELF